MSRGKRGLILSLVVATTIFSTAAIANAASLNVNLDQCANGVPRQTVDCTWQNGDLNAQNSQWREGDGIPFRVVISGLTAGAHSIHINYDFIDNGKHAYDTLETYNATIVTPPIHDSLPTGITFPSGSAISTAFPHDTTFDSGYNPETGLPRNLTTYGANSVTMGALTHSGDQGDLVVNFDNSTSGSDTIVMLWAGHLAIGTSGWGTGLGAASINGAPFHMRTQQLDGSGNKNQDRSIQPAAIILPPAITINKTADHTTVNAGEQIGYVVTLSNTGSGDATGVTLNDSLPGGSGINWSLAGAGTSIPSGVACAVTGTTPNQSLSCGTDPATTGTFTLAAGATITLHVTSPTTGGSCGTLHNTASFNSTNGGTGSVGPIDITINCPTLVLSKTADHATVNAGQSIGYVVTLHNSGAGDATGVTLSDPLPGGTGINWSLATSGTSIPSGIACAVGGTVPNQTLSCGTSPATTGTFTLAAGATITLHVTSPTTGGFCGTLHNTVSAHSDNDGSPTVGPIDITINCPTLVLSKTADHATVNAGESIGYVVTLHNSGAGDATGVTLSDPLPGGTGINWSLATSGTSIPSGIACAVHGTAPQTLSCGTDPATTGTFTLAAGATITLHVTSKTTAASCGTLHNTVSAHSDNDGSPTVGPINITINCPHITIAKTPDNGTATGGDTIAFTITVSNAGPGVAHNVVITDVLPSGGGLSWSIDAAGTTAANCSISSGTLTCNQGDLASGASVHVRVTSPTTAAECGSTIDNTGAVTLSNGDGGQDPGSITVSCPILSINIEKGGPDVTHVGDTVHYTLTVTNGTQEPLQNVVVTDTKCDSPPVLQSGDTNNDTILQPGEVWVYTCDHVVTSSDSDPLINVATVHATDKLGRPTEDQATHSVDILHPSISIVKTANPTSGAPGDTVTYTFVVKNTSTDTTLFNITVVDDKLGVINATPIASLAPGQSVTLTKTTTLPNAGGALTNVGTATGADVLGKKVSAHDNATVTVVLAVLVKTGTDSSGIGLVGFLFIAVGIAMATRKERGRVRPAFATSSSAAGRAVMLAANRRSWRMRRRRGPPTRARLRWRRSQGPPMRDGP